MSGSIRARCASAASPEQGQLDGIRAVLESVRASATAATTAHDQARETHAAASAALAEAEARYAAGPDDSGAADVHAAERSLRLAEVRLAATKKKQAEAERALDGSLAALESATTEAKKIGLADRSNQAYLASAVAEPWRVLISAYAALEQASLEIGSALKDSHNASAELRALGMYERDLDPLHAILPALDWMASKGVVLSDLDGARPSQGITAAAIVAFLEANSKAQPAPSNHQEAFRARLARIRGTRTALEATEMEREEARLRSVAAMASYRAPSRSQAAAPAPLAPALVPVVTSNETSTARRSSAPGRRSGHDERE